MRYSNEFYFVTPADLVRPSEIPPECGLVEAGQTSPGEWREIMPRQAGFFSYDADTQAYCLITVPAPWRDTPGPTWHLVAAMMRNQRRDLGERLPAPIAQQKLDFS